MWALLRDSADICCTRVGENIEHSWPSWRHLFTLHFAKAFDLVPHERLLLKAHHYRFRRKLHIWLCGFLTDWRQCIVMNGSSVLSGVAQGTVLRSILFLLFINDLPVNVASGIKMFANDCILFRNITSPQDHAALQQDLNSLEEWTATWQMYFLPKKCMAMSVSLKRYPLYYQYSICDVPLEGVQYQKYLPGRVHHCAPWTGPDSAKRLRRKPSGFLVPSRGTRWVAVVRLKNVPIWPRCSLC